MLMLGFIAAGCSDDNSPAASGTTVTASQVSGMVVIDFTGSPSERPAVSMPFKVEQGSKALDALKQALGDNNVSTQEFPGLGAFVTGFYGVQAQGNHFWEFSVNGKSSDVGAGSYEVKDGDAIQFRYTSF